jgi:hypothetical protein
MPFDFKVPLFIGEGALEASPFGMRKVSADMMKFVNLLRQASFDRQGPESYLSSHADRL